MIELQDEVALAEKLLDDGQRVIDRKRKTFFGRLPWHRKTLDRLQNQLDCQRIRIEAAKQYLNSVE